MNIRTASATRTKAAAAAVLIALSVGALTGCSGNTNIMYQDTAGWTFIAIDGNTVTMSSPSCDEIKQTISDIDNGVFGKESADYTVEIGTLNEARNIVVWSDGDDDPIQIEDHMIRYDDEVFGDYNTDQAKTAREGNKPCD